MGVIYIHIPFCKQACFYCDFYFSTSLKHKNELLETIKQEAVIRKSEVSWDVDAVYFGGGTPSLMSPSELESILAVLYQNFSVSKNVEITLEANPDDITRTMLSHLKGIGVNRLSLGIQSFFDSDLKQLHRVHNGNQAQQALEDCMSIFSNISVDLIYGIPDTDIEKWHANIDKALAYAPPHISAYALTVEPKTVLENRIKTGKSKPLDEALARQHYYALLDRLGVENYINYEFSNFGKSGFFSRANSSYWTGKPYLGLGPSAHSYNGATRRWNVSNNSVYIHTINQQKTVFTEEILTPDNSYNEYVLTRLRTQQGISIHEVLSTHGEYYKDLLMKSAEKHLNMGALYQTENTLRVSKNSLFLTDGISSDLFSC